MSEENNLSIVTITNDWVTGGNESWYLQANNETTSLQTLFQNSIIYRIQLWVVPFLVAFGGVGNVLSLWVFCSPAFKGHSSSCYLAALAASDTMFLITLLMVWISSTVIDLYNLQGWCQGITYLIHVATFVSVWLIVAFTVERFIAVCYPLLRSVVCTVRRARIVVCVLVSVAVSLYSYLLLAAGLEPVSPEGGFQCTLREGWRTMASVMNSVDTLLTLILPVLAIVTLNLRIARCVYYVDKLGSKELSATGLPVPQRRFVSQRKSRRGGDDEETAYCATYSAQKTRKAQHNVTKMLLVISTIFILLNLPSYVMRAYMYFTSLYMEGDQYTMTLYTLEQTFTLLFYSNFAVNFLLYCVTGQNFRRAVSTLFVPPSKRQQYTNMRASTMVRNRPNNASLSTRGSIQLRRASQSSRPITASVMLVDFTTEGTSRFSTKRKSLKITKNPDVAMTSITCPEDEETPLNGQCQSNSISSKLLHPLMKEDVTKLT